MDGVRPRRFQFCFALFGAPFALRFLVAGKMIDKRPRSAIIKHRREPNVLVSPLSVDPTAKIIPSVGMSSATSPIFCSRISPTTTGYHLAGRWDNSVPGFRTAYRDQVGAASFCLPRRIHISSRVACQYGRAPWFQVQCQEWSACHIADCVLN